MIEEILNKIYTSDLLSNEELHELTEWVCNKDEEIERLNNIIDKINKLYDCNTHCENIYYAIGVLLNKEYCDIEGVWEDELLDILKGVDKE